MKLNFTNISDTGKATMLCYKHIGNDSEMGMGIDGNAFANEVLWLNQYSDCKEIEVRINSVGGSVSEGLSVCSAILNSEKPVTTIIDGMAYSMAGVIAMCGSKKKMVDYGTFMMHNAQGGSDEDVLNLITNSLARIFERTTALNITTCRALMEKETWMDANECLKMGLVDEIIKTTNKKPVSNTVTELHSFYNQLLNKKPMIKVTNLLKLSNDASEDAIVESISKIETEKADLATKVTDLEKELSEAKTKLTAFEDAENAKEAAAKLEVIENAIKEKKADASKKDYFVNSTMSSIELKDLFGAITVPYTPVFNNSTATQAANGEDKSKWNFQDWMKKDAAGLIELKNSSPVDYDNLVKGIDTIKSKN